MGNHRRIHNVLLPALNFNLNVNNISNATITANNSDALEATRSVLDLFVVSVLLDAGAGDVWKYREERTGETYGRSVG